MPTGRFIQLLFVFAALLLVSHGAADARDIVNAALKSPSIDLTPVLETVETDKDQVAIEIPNVTGTQKTLMTLQAIGTGSTHRWVVFSLLNPDSAPHDLVIVSPNQGFVGSGFLWPRREGSRIFGIQNSAGNEPRTLSALGVDALAFTIEPNASQTFALEVTPAGLSGLSLWQRGAFESEAGEYAFLRGMVIGIAMLLAGVMLIFLVLRQRAVFLAASIFALSSLLFLGIEAGYLRALLSWLPLGADGSQKLRAIVESLMFAGLVLCLLTFLELRKRLPVLATLLAVLAASAAGLAAYGWYQPEIATGLARLGFGAVAVGGFFLTFTLWRRGLSWARATLVPWTVLLAWTVLAGLGVADLIPFDNGRLVISAGLALVLLTMGFTLAQFAFSHGIMSSRFFEDSGRRALALAGSEQTVWDWQVDRAALYVGPELERALGLETGSVMSKGLKSWLELIHPADRAAYVAAVEAAERRGKGTFAQEFRLRRHDGTYRWYLLRARSMLSQDGRAARCIGTLADITGVKRSEDRLLSDAVRDRITGLPNRALFLDRLEFAMRRAHTENNNELYVIVIDLDRFKTVNDGLGHEVGDSLLSVTGRRLQGLVGPEDTLARLPGDQFAIIFNGRHPKRDVIPFTEQVRTTLSRPIKLRGRELFLTASFGVARFLDDRTSGPDFVKDAEIALYEAKRRGRDSTEFFRPDMRDDRSELLTLEQDLRRAVERNEIEVVYQPITRLSDMGLAGFEALIRWRHRTEGLLSPDAFMGLAEETGIIKDLSRLVLNESARQLGIWQRAFRPDKPLFVSVNVSSSQLLNTELVDDVRALLGREDIIEGTLKVELTESMVMENPELSIEVLERLKALGVGLACDDFGTGYSALANLRRLPFDMLKIDKSFLEADPEDEKAMIVLETIILLAHDLRLTVVAEGIEDQDQIGRLAELECDFAQGFLIGEPMSAKQVIEALGGGTFAAAKPGSPGFWSRITGRGPGRETTPAPPPGTAPMATAPPAPAAQLRDDLDDILEPEPPRAVAKDEDDEDEAIDLGDAGADEQADEQPDEQREDVEPLAAAAEDEPDEKAPEEKTPVAEKPKPAPAPEPVRPSVSFRSMLTLPDPEALPPVPPPPPRPAEIFGMTPKPVVNSAPKSEKLAPRVPNAAEPEPHAGNGSEPLVAEEVEAGEAPVPPPPNAGEPTEIAVEATIVETQPKPNRRRSKSSK